MRLHSSSVSGLSERPRTRVLGSVISQAHRYLLHLARDECPDWQDCPRAALHWLEDRQLIEPALCDGKPGYQITARGRRAVLGWESQGG